MTQWLALMGSLLLVALNMINAGLAIEAAFAGDEYPLLVYSILVIPSIASLIHLHNTQLLLPGREGRLSMIRPVTASDSRGQWWQLILDCGHLLYRPKKRAGDGSLVEIPPVSAYCAHCETMEFRSNAGVEAS